MKRILVIGPLPPPYNGMSVVTQNLLTSSLSKQFDLIHLDTADRIDVSISKAGKLTLENLYLAIMHSAKFFKLLFLRKPDLVYIPISQQRLAYIRDSIFLILSKLFKKRVIVHLHGGYFKQFYEKSGPFVKILIRYTLKDVNRVIVLGESLRSLFSGIVPDERIRVVPNGASDFDLEKISKPKEKKGPFIILYLGSLRKSKGFMNIIYAARYVIRKNRNVRFVLAGGWRFKDEKKEALEFIQRNSLQDYFEFPGVVVGREKVKLFLKSDIFVFPSIEAEGQPLVILEAMAAGLPIITTDQGCIRETIIDGENGFIIEENNISRLADKVLQLISNNMLRQQMGIANRRRFLRYYTLDKFARNIGKVFAEVMEDSRK